MIPVALSWAVTAHFIAGLSESAFVKTSVGSVDHLRRNVLRSFERAMLSKALVSLPENEGTSSESSLRVSDGGGPPRLESEIAVRSNVLPFPAGPDPSQRRITLTVAELVAILKAANTAPESLTAALAAAGVVSNPQSTLPDGKN